ncbi:LPXTG cell wall anchor domain-containing protein [Demequina pelophila]|uniref:LPXTG cell wall anchor domain-containing protein n=1 Tax=Demequina pelophila TaxID=1638984 RepID=UPI0007829DE0|nr:LPXTG cell wall anchor domain-containing protein [Demequina pelophila]
MRHARRSTAARPAIRITAGTLAAAAALTVAPFAISTATAAVDAGACAAAGGTVEATTTNGGTEEICVPATNTLDDPNGSQKTPAQVDAPPAPVAPRLIPPKSATPVVEPPKADQTVVVDDTRDTVTDTSPAPVIVTPEPQQTISADSPVPDDANSAKDPNYAPPAPTSPTLIPPKADAPVVAPPKSDDSQNQDADQDQYVVIPDTRTTVGGTSPVPADANSAKDPDYAPPAPTSPTLIPPKADAPVVAPPKSDDSQNQDADQDQYVVIPDTRATVGGTSPVPADANSAKDPNADQTIVIPTPGSIVGGTSPVPDDANSAKDPNYAPPAPTSPTLIPPKADAPVVAPPKSDDSQNQEGQSGFTLQVGTPDGPITTYVIPGPGVSTGGTSPTPGSQIGTAAAPTLSQATPYFVPTKTPTATPTLVPSARPTPITVAEPQLEVPFSGTQAAAAKEAIAQADSASTAMQPIAQRTSTPAAAHLEAAVAKTGSSDAVVTTTASSLAHTGVDDSTLLLGSGGAALILAGAGFTVVARRRQDA